MVKHEQRNHLQENTENNKQNRMQNTGRYLDIVKNKWFGTIKDM
jgi:hypothetical protein